MNILDITCNDMALQNILFIVKNVLKIIQIIVPIVLIGATILNITKLMANPEDKKLPKKIFNSVLATIIVFMIPVFVNVTMGLIGENTNISSCWNNATSKTGTNSHYIDPNGFFKKKQKSSVNNSSGYESGNTNNSSKKKVMVIL